MRHKHLIQMKKVEQETELAWGREWAKLEDRRTELERYKERRVLLEKMLPNWECFDGAGLLTSFLIKERTK